MCDPIRLFLVLATLFPAMAQAQSPGVSKDTVVFGQSASFSGSSAALGADLYLGAAAYFEQVNRRGGVHGRKIKIIPVDDGYEGNRTLKNTINLILKEKVFALFGYVGTPTIVKALPAIQKFSSSDLFLFSNFTGAQPQREPPHSGYVFNVRSSYRQETARLVDYLVGKGIHKIGVFIQNDAYGRSGEDGVARALKHHGFTIVGEATYERGSDYHQSYAQQVSILQNKGAQAVISIGSYKACAGFIRDARKAKFAGYIANVSFVGADSLLNLLTADKQHQHFQLTDKLINSQVVPPWSDTRYPLVAAYQRDFTSARDTSQTQLATTLLKSGHNNFSFVSLEGYLNAMLLVHILKNVGPDLTRARFKKIARTMQPVDLGMMQSLAFTGVANQASNKVFLTTVKEGQYVTIDDITETQKGKK